MIVFTLDALADDSHRRHLIDPLRNLDFRIVQRYTDGSAHLHDASSPEIYLWRPNYPAYYEACDGDAPIKPVTKVFSDLKHRFGEKSDVVIWSSCCESARDKLENWIYQNIQGMCQYDLQTTLKLRPIGDDRPQAQLFAEWYNEWFTDERILYRKDIECVFSSHGPTIDMFRRRGIFVFDCNQNL